VASISFFAVLPLPLEEARENNTLSIDVKKLACMYASNLKVFVLRDKFGEGATHIDAD
jgi:hypothetical protein